MLYDCITCDYRIYHTYIMIYEFCDCHTSHHITSYLLPKFKNKERKENQN